MSDENQRLKELYQTIGFKPTPRLHQVLEAGLSEASNISREEALVTVPFLILGILFVGRHQPQNLEFATGFYNAIGSEETDKITKRVRQFHPIASYSEPVGGMHWISSDYFDILNACASSNSETISEISPEDVIVTLLEKRPKECRILFEQHIDIWDTLLSATRKAIAGLTVSESFEFRLRDLEEVSRRTSTSTEKNNPRSTRPPSTSLKEWRQYLNNRYGKQFTDGAIRIIISACEAAEKERGNIDNLITVNTKHLLVPLVVDPGPLRTLHLGNHAGAYSGIPPWHEPQTDTDESDTARIVYGKTRPSVEFAAVLQTAAGLAESTIGFPEVTEWHLAFAAISSSANGIKWQLHAQKSSLASGAIVLRRNLANHQPQLEPLFNWSDLEDDSEPFVDEDVDESQLDDESRKWSRNFHNLRKPKDFRWSASCARALDELWHSHGLAVAFARQSKPRAKRFNPELTPRSLFLACLRCGAKTENDNTPPSSDDDNLLNILFHSTGKTVEQLDKLLQNELHRGREESAAASDALKVSERLTTTIARANEIRLNTGNDRQVSPRHLMAALLHPFEGGGTGSLVLLASDEIDRKPLLDTLETDIAKTPRGIERDQPDLWIPWLNRLRQGMEHPLPNSRPNFRKSKPIDGKGHTQDDENTTDETENHAATEEPTLTTGSSADSEESPEPVPTGGQHNTSRHPHADELCLDIDRYAEASAQLLKNASDESDFVFGLFGPWGRGKTTLAEEIQFRVQKKGYVCVRFCAWKYPTRPEIWVHLYEEILRRAQMRLESGKERADLELPDEESWLQRLKISFRVGILSQGWSPLVLGSVLLLVSRLHWLDLSLGIGRAIGWSGAILLAAFALRSTHWIKALRFHYGVLPTHRDKLGLQSVVGHDLTNLLKVWISPASVSAPKPLRRFWLLWVSAGSVCFASILAAVGVLNHVASASQFGTLTGAPRFPVTEEASSFGDLVADKLPGFMGWPFRTIDNAHFEPLSTGLWIAGILVIIGLISVLIAALIRFKPQTFERLLLVVDDLDRCEPDQMLAVVESLRVFLDKSEMSRRLQILMLIDDRKLDQAILKRAREQRWIPKTRQEREAYCREQREKYFVTSIRLAQLDDDDISDITSKILDREANEDQAKRLRELKAREEANKRSLAKDDSAVSTTHVEKPARTIQHSVGPNLPKTEVTEIESEVRRPATSQEMDQERDLIRAEKDRAQIEEDERKKIEDELGRRTTNRLPKDINEKTKFTPIERRLLHEWVHEQSDEHTSPRTIRTLITRYLLARLMISTFGFEPDARTLLSALTGRPLDAKLQPEELRAYQRVAATLQQSS